MHGLRIAATGVMRRRDEEGLLLRPLSWLAGGVKTTGQNGGINLGARPGTGLVILSLRPLWDTQAEWTTKLHHCGI